jgi:hypothetical protein
VAKEKEKQESFEETTKEEHEGETETTMKGAKKIAKRRREGEIFEEEEKIERSMVKRNKIRKHLKRLLNSPIEPGGYRDKNRNTLFRM